MSPPPPLFPAFSSPLPPADLAGKKVLVMGLGRFGGGVGVAQWLVQQGARVTVNDAAPEAELTASMQKLAGLPIAFKLGGHTIEDFLTADLMVINPAVDKAKSEVVQAALAKGVAHTTEMNLFLERCRGQTVGVTGSVGKSTTTALIYEAVKAGLHQASEGQNGPRVFLGGNIGRSLLLDLPRIRAMDWVVLELSSFMLEETPEIAWSPNIAVVTNVFPNHLDRHGTMAAYTAAKQNILRFQRPEDVAILNGDHELVSRWVHLARGKAVKFTTRGPAGGPTLMVPGEHNRSNAAAASAVLEAIAVAGTALDRGAAVRAMEGFRGLPHRLQLVHTVMAGPESARREVGFYNDSKATTPEASITALRAFAPRTAIFIVGGYDKHSDLSAFAELLARQAAGVLGIGQTGRSMIDAVTAQAGLPAERVRYAGTLAEATRQAHGWAAEDGRVGAVVLSPACASWDQFPNYEVRGEQFVTASQTIN